MVAVERKRSEREEDEKGGKKRPTVSVFSNQLPILQELERYAMPSVFCDYYAFFYVLPFGISVISIKEKNTYYELNLGLQFYWTEISIFNFSFRLK